MKAMRAAMDSATMTEIQMPLMPRRKGRRMMAEVSKTRVRRKDRRAERGPLFSAVKKQEP